MQQQPSTKDFKGWSNDETRVVYTWLSTHEEELCRFREVYQSDSMMESEASVLLDSMLLELLGYYAVSDVPSLFHDLMHAIVEHVDWDEIMRHE